MNIVNVSLIEVVNMMRLFAISLLVFLFACSDLQDQELNDAYASQPTSDGNETTSSQPIDDDNGKAGLVEEATFIGTIEEINGDTALVAIEEGAILNSGSIVDIDLSVASDTTFEIGDKVRVGYDGIIRETYPLGINTIFVELLN